MNDQSGIAGVAGDERSAASPTGESASASPRSGFGPRRWRSALAVAVPFGLAAAGLSIVTGRLALDHFGPAPTDGNFVLDTPGIFSEPADSDLSNVAIDGQRLPPVDLLDVDGATTRLAVSRPTIVNLWFSTCAPCERELPDFAVIDAEFGDRIDVVGVDPFDTVEAMVRFADDRGVDYSLLRDPQQEFTNALGVVAFPVTLFVDSDGVILRQLGEVDEATLRTTIDELFPASTASNTVSDAVTSGEQTGIDQSDGHDGHGHGDDDDGDDGEDDD